MFKCLLLSVMLSAALIADVVPMALLKALESEDFKVREAAQTDLLLWARKNPQERIVEMLRLSSDGGSPSPEVRERCMQVLRQLAEDDFAREGEGYLGVRMNDRMLRLPKSQQDRWAVVVADVLPDSAAEKCGLKAGDAILELDSQAWREAGSRWFSGQIRKRRPGTRVQLKILRNEALQNIRVELGCRPADADQMFVPGVDPEERKALDQQAKDAHFQRWLLEKKARR